MQLTMNRDLCKQVNRMQLELLAFGRACVTPKWRGNATSPIYSRLYYIVRGSFFVITPDQKITHLEQGRWYLLPAGCSFSYGCTEEMEHYFFHLKLCAYDGIDQLRCCNVPLRLQPADDPADRLAKGLEGSTIHQALEIHQLVYRVLLKLMEESKVRISGDELSECVMKAIQYIRANLSARLTVPEIAEHASVSKSTLTKFFKQELSMSIKDYLFSLIMAEAEYQLRDSKKSILAISEQLGFSDQFYFSRKFKEKFEKSPREYRKNSPTQL